MVLYVTFLAVDEEGKSLKITLSTNTKVYQKQVNNCKKYCKLNKLVFLEITKIE